MATFIWFIVFWGTILIFLMLFYLLFKKWNYKETTELIVGLWMSVILIGIGIIHWGSYCSDLFLKINVPVIAGNNNSDFNPSEPSPGDSVCLTLYDHISKIKGHAIAWYCTELKLDFIEPNTNKVTKLEAYSNFNYFNKLWTKNGSVTDDKSTKVWLSFFLPKNEKIINKMLTFKIKIAFIPAYSNEYNKFYFDSVSTVLNINKKLYIYDKNDASIIQRKGTLNIITWITAIISVFLMISWSRLTKRIIEYVNKS